MWLPLLFYKTLSSVSFSDSAAPLGLSTGFLYNRTARENSRYFLKLGGGDGRVCGFDLPDSKTSCGCTSKRHTGTLRQNEFCPEVPGAPFQKCCALFEYGKCQAKLIHLHLKHSAKCRLLVWYGYTKIRGRTAEL